MNLIEFQMKFQNEQTCIEWLAEKRWGKDNAICPHCGSNHHCKHKTRSVYTCLECKKQYTVRIGTIFEESRLPLFKWFVAIYLFTSNKKGISSVQLSKYLSITQKSAWFMLQRIREVMKSDGGMFGGITEIDEAFKIHTNTIEGFWSQLKRGLYGVYHWASDKHIQKYVNEFSYRYNNKEITDFESFANWFGRCEGKRLFYNVLIG